MFYALRGREKAFWNIMPHLSLSQVKMQSLYLAHPFRLVLLFALIQLLRRASHVIFSECRLFPICEGVWARQTTGCRAGVNSRWEFIINWQGGKKHLRDSLHRFGHERSWYCICSSKWNVASFQVHLPYCLFISDVPRSNSYHNLSYHIFF